MQLLFNISYNCLYRIIHTKNLENVLSILHSYIVILNPIVTHIMAYVILSGLRALIMHSFCNKVLFFHSPGNFSFSGVSLSTNFFQRLADPSMSLSRFLNWSMLDAALMPPQLVWERKSTGLVTLGVMGKRSRKSSSGGSMDLLISNICKDRIEERNH